MIRQTGNLYSISCETVADALTDVAVCCLDSAGHIRSSNRAMALVTGYDANELIGMPFYKLHAADQQDSSHVMHMLKTARTHGKFEEEALRVRRDGQAFRAQIMVYPIRNAANTSADLAHAQVGYNSLDTTGKAEGFVALMRDITAQYQSLQRLRESDRQFRMLVEGVVDYAIFMLDRDGVVTNWNSGAERIKGYTAGEIIGRHFSCFYTEEDQVNGLPQRTIDNARREGQHETEGWRVRKDGTRFWANAVVDAIYSSSGELMGFAKITRDITEQRKAQVALDDTRAQLAHAQRMESIGQLTGGIAHDFNNLLTGMIGSLELLQHRLRQGETHDIGRFADAALGAAHRAASLTHRLLAFARRQPLDPQPVRANSLVHSLDELFRRTLGENITLEFNTAPDLWVTQCDPLQLENALVNLVINARDAMPNGGTVRIETRNAFIDPRYEARLNEVAPGEYICIAVRDTGSGMSQETVSRAFDPFFTTKPMGAGTGLGLSMVHGFARQSEGFAKLESESGRGTQVEIYLPRLTSEVAISELPVAAASSVMGEGYAMLVVEDEPAVRYLVAEVLREAGFRVFEASNGPSALEVLQSDQHFDLLITDVGLPGMNGRELADEARVLRPCLRVLFMTGYAESAISSGFLKPGMEMMTKPFTLDTLLKKVGHIVEPDGAAAPGNSAKK